MRYAILIYDAETANPPSEPPAPEVMEQVMGEWNAYTQMLRDRGVYQGGEALQPVQTATTVRQQGNVPVTTDGPFAETKEALGGFYLVDARDLDEALELATACPGVRYGGSVEVRPVFDFSPGAVDAASAASAQV